jgi:hypothetical protein
VQDAAGGGDVKRRPPKKRKMEAGSYTMRGLDKNRKADYIYWH